MKYAILIIVSAFLLGSSCKKNKDTITNQTVNGMVYNQCTDSGLAGVTVYLKINKDNQSFKNYETVSGANGVFSFANAEIHSNSDYTYLIYIESLSGTAAQLPSQTRFDGASLSFNADEASKYFIPRVTPGFFHFNYAYQQPNSATANDSIEISAYQSIIHKNIPIMPYTLNGFFYGNQAPSGTSGGYPMGLYVFEIKKWKNSVYSFTKDSLYIGWADSKTYTINW